MLSSKNGSDKTYKRRTECAQGVQSFLLIVVSVYICFQSRSRDKIRMRIQLLTLPMATQWHQTISLRLVQGLSLRYGGIITTLWNESEYGRVTESQDSLKRRVSTISNGF